jgi:hypothetical protein
VTARSLLIAGALVAVVAATAALTVQVVSPRADFTPPGAPLT